MKKHRGLQKCAGNQGLLGRLTFCHPLKWIFKNYSFNIYFLGPRRNWFFYYKKLYAKHILLVIHFSRVKAGSILWNYSMKCSPFSSFSSVCVCFESENFLGGVLKMQNLDAKVNYSSLINSTMSHIIWFWKFNLLPPFSSYCKYVLQKSLLS